MNISSVSRNEGQSGTTPFTSTVSLLVPSETGVSVNFATADGSARSPEDYEAKSGSLAIPAGQTSKTITVNVKGDRKVEWEEVLCVMRRALALAVVTLGAGLSACTTPIRGRAVFWRSRRRCS
jgi:hypothetical protein